MQTSDQYKRQTSIKVRPVQTSDQYKGQTSTKVGPVQTSDQYKGQTSTNVCTSPNFVSESDFCTVRSLYRQTFVGPTFVPLNGVFEYSIQMVDKETF